MTEIRIVDPKTGGIKGKKPERYDLIPPGFLIAAVLPTIGTEKIDVEVTDAIEALDDFRLERHAYLFQDAFAHFMAALHYDGYHAGDELARVYDMGASKYADWNWLKGYAWSLSFASACRHASLWGRGEKVDAESGLHHLAHGAWHAVTLHIFATKGLGTDDLYRGPAAK